MAVNTTDIKTALLNCGSGVTTFPFSFKILEDSDLKVYLINSAGVRELLGLPADYSVSAVNDDFSSGGNVETVATYASGNKILIVRAVTNKQESDYTHGDDLPADMLENDFDRRCMVEQEAGEKLSRALCFPVEDETTLDAELAPKADRLGKYLYFDGTNGEPTMVDILEPAGALSVTDFAETLLDDADADAVIATLVGDAANGAAGIKGGMESILAVDGENYTVTDIDGVTIINLTTGASNRTITLPTVADNVKRKLRLRKVDDGAGYGILDGEGAETINGIASWYLFNQYDYVDVEGDGTEWFVIGGTEPELIYWHEADWTNGAPVQNTWYAVTNFQLALPTGGSWEIEFADNVNCGAGGNIELTCADGSAEEDDDKYTLTCTASDITFQSKTFRRTFVSNVTLYINARTTIAGANPIYVKGEAASGYLRARRIC